MLILVIRRLHHPSAWAKAPAHASSCRPSSSGGPCGWCFEDMPLVASSGLLFHSCNHCKTTLGEDTGFWTYSRPGTLSPGLGAAPGVPACTQRLPEEKGCSARRIRWGEQKGSPGPPPAALHKHIPAAEASLEYLWPKEDVPGNFFHPTPLVGLLGLFSCLFCKAQGHPFENSNTTRVTLM